MSKLTEMVMATDTGYRKPVSSVMSVESVTDDQSYPFSAQSLRKYRIEARLYAEALVGRDERQLVAAIGEAKRHLIEAVFGEFRRDFREAHRALWNRDFDRAVAILEAMESRMFEGWSHQAADAVDPAATFQREPSTRVENPEVIR